MSCQVRTNIVSDTVMGPAEAGYVAGIVDGEGSISLTAQSRRGPGKLVPCLRVASTHLPMLERLVAITGNGRIIRRNLAARANRPCYDWSITANQMRHLLPQIQPYLIIKTRHAELVLQYLSLVRGNLGVAEENADTVEAIRESLRQLNDRSISPEEQEALREEYGKHECSEPDCQRRCYGDSEWCYQHWRVIQSWGIGRCQRCGKEMPMTDPRRRFCSDNCQQQDWWATKGKEKREAAAAQRPSVACLACGKPVDQSGYAGKMFCNAHCQAVHRARQKKLPEGYQIEKQCAQCGTAFHTKFGKQKYCSDACNKAAYRERMKPE